MTKLYALLALTVTAVGFIAAASAAQDASPTPTPITPTMQGKALAEQTCQACHAIGTTGESPNPKAMPLRDISKLYPVESLTEAFGEGVLAGHGGMPEYQFEPHQVEALLAYISSVQTRRSASGAKPKAN